MDIGFREVSRGIFEIKVFSESDKKRLENKFVNFEFGERSHQLTIARVPLVLQPKRLFFENPKWITVDRLYNSSLSQAPDEELDNFFSKFGDIIIKTHDDTDEYGFKNGKKKIKLDLKKDIERWTELQLKGMIQGKEVQVRGKVNIFYKGQPYKCRECDDIHTDKCPQRLAREEAEKAGEKERQARLKTLLIGDSNLRYVNEQAMYAQTDCAKGAKIGHIATKMRR